MVTVPAWLFWMLLVGWVAMLVACVIDYGYQWVEWHRTRGGKHR